jgi:hypothetical protein
MKVYCLNAFDAFGRLVTAIANPFLSHLRCLIHFLALKPCHLSHTLDK